MSPGVVAQIKADWQHHYRKPGAPVVGVVQALSPSGAVARIRFDDFMDSYILVSHLEPAEPGAVLAPGVLAARHSETPEPALVAVY